MFRSLVVIACSVLITIAFLTFIRIFAEIQNTKGLRSVVFLYVLMATDYALLIWNGKDIIMKQILLIVLHVIFVRFYLHLYLKKAIIISIVFDAIEISAFAILILIVKSITVIESNWTFGKMRFYICYAIGFFLIITFVKYSAGIVPHNPFLDKNWLRIIILPILTIGIISLVLNEIQIVPTKVLLPIALIAVLIVNLIQFYLLIHIIQVEEKRLEYDLYKKKMEGEADKYMALAEALDKERHMTHEFNNHILGIQALLKEEKYKRLEKYVKNLKEQLLDYKSEFRTGNDLVDAVLNAMFQEMEKNKILFVARINDLSDFKIEDHDIVALLVNLLNNAIEACAKVQGNRIIKMRLTDIDNEVVLAVQNTYEDGIIYEGGTPVSKKQEDAERHGYGIKNVVQIVKKYGGEYSIVDNAGEFVFYIVMNTKNENVCPT